MNNSEINNYYDECHIDYKRIWGTDKTFCIHYGYYDDKHKNHFDAQINMIKVVSEVAKIKDGFKVLDAGCGIGGTSIWIAKNYKTNVNGININNNQIKKAKDIANNERLKGDINFLNKDFTNTGIAKSSFDAVIFLESGCYADDKKDIITEAYRLLKKGGKLVVADGFLKKENLDQSEEKIMKNWLDGWMVPNLASVRGFNSNLKTAGFSLIEFKDIKKNVYPSSVKLYRSGMLLYPFGKILEYIGVRSKSQTKNIISTIYQHIGLKKDLWTYGIYSATK